MSKVSQAHDLARSIPIDGKTCETCGHDQSLVKHHDDYDKPLEIRVLCRSCHVKWHKANGPGLNSDVPVHAFYGGLFEVAVPRQKRPVKRTPTKRALAGGNANRGRRRAQGREAA